MHGYLKTRPLLSQSFIFISLVCAGLLIFVMMLGTWIASKATGISLFELADMSKWDASDPRYLKFLRWMLAAQFIGVFVAPALVFAYLSDPQPRRYLGLKQSHILYFVLGIVIMVAALPLVEYLGAINEKVTFPSGMESWMKETELQAQKQIRMLLGNSSLAGLLINIVLIAGFAGIGEELLFRGVVQRLAIWAFKNVWAGIIIAALLFSAMHMQFYGFLPRFFLGILLGAIYWYSGSLWPAMAAHFFYDALLITLAYFNPSMISEEQSHMVPQAYLPWLGLASAAVVAALLFLMKRRSVQTKAAFLAERYVEPETRVRDGV